ncbi:uncharacterized protein LOC117328136 [Pecten maximus]|uniref:uncharacterized protein LOC117328136 n=1 Tax=Pecten maximus TaxID=6579 RepID=UPI0014583361|nr:uncharacterized protein LOC117328136 [Pecten maximus]
MNMNMITGQQDSVQMKRRYMHGKRQSRRISEECQRLTYVTLRSQQLLRIFDGSHGPVARRFFVHCATECLQEIDEKEPWRWIPTKQQTCEYRNRSQLSPFGPEIAYKKHKLMFEKSKGKYVIIAEHERRNSTKEKFLKHARKKRKNKQRDVSQIPKSSEKTEMFRPNDEVNETMDVLRGNQTTIKTDVKENGVYRSHSRRYESKCRITSPGKCVTTERTPSTCGVKNNDHGINVVIPSSEKESPEGMLKRQKQQQTSAGTDEKLTKDIEVALDDQHGIGQASSAMSCGYAVNPDKPRENTVAGGRSITYPKQDDVEESTSCSNRKQQSQSTSTKKTFKGSGQGTTTNIGISTKEQTCNRRRSITCVRECEREKSINTQSSASNEEMRDTYNCINFEDDSYTNKKDISHEILSSLSRSQRRRDGDKKYTSSDNDADLSSSDCNEVPRRKSKVRYKKKRNVSAQRKETTDGAGTGFDNPGVRKCYLSRESKQILATLQQHDTSNNVPYDEGSFSEKDSCEFTSVCNETMTSLNVNTSQVSVGCIKDQSNETVVWEFSETDMRQSDCKEEIDEDSDTDYTDFCPSCTSLRFQRKSDSKDIVNKEDIDFSEEEMLESNDSYWTKDFSYDTDESSPDSLLGDEGYLMVNMSDTFHSESVTSSSSESFTNQYMVRSSLSENTLGSRSFCSSEYSSVHKDDCTTTKSPPLCYKSTGFYFYQKSDTSLHSQPSKSTSLVDNSSTYGILDSNRIVSGGNSNGETGQSNIEHSRIENKSNNDPSQDPIQSSSMEVNYRTSGQSSINNKNVVTAQLNGTPRSFDPTDVSHGSFAEIQEQGESSSNNEERPVNLREHHFRRHHDVGDRTTSVDDVRRHRESRRQRGILQYQWNGIYALSQMYENRVGHRIRRYRIWLRAWLDRRRQWLQRNN